MTTLNPEIFSILQSPDDGTPIRPDMTTDSGLKYEITETGVLVLKPSAQRPAESVYATAMFKKWLSVLSVEFGYYTGRRSVAGTVANLWSYTSVKRFNQRRKGQWVLDIGCGDGACVEHLKDRSTYVGLDLIPERLISLKQRYPESTAIFGDATCLPFKSGSLASVFSSNAFEHMWYLKDVALELHRCVPKNGEVVIVIPTEGGLWNLGRILSGRYFRKKYPDIDFDFISHVEHCNQATQIARTLEIFFHVKKKYLPVRIPSVMTNLFLELYCRPKDIEGLSYRIGCRE